jgi:GntR family transcriptional regulator/MocR family aminotransferase
MYAYLSEVQIQKDAETPVYIQLKNAFCKLILTGALAPGVNIPSSRFLSEWFGINRRTVVAAMDELLVEGWIKTNGRYGTFVNEQLPVVKATGISRPSIYPSKVSFEYQDVYSGLFSHTPPVVNLHGFDDGFPDSRIAPLNVVGKVYKETLVERAKLLSRNVDLLGSTTLRTEIAKELAVFRALAVRPENVFITQGSQMNLYMIARLLIHKGDNVIVSKPNYLHANICFQHFGAKLIEVGVDKEGMKIEEVEAHCKRRKIRCLYITPHHHDPTTVTLSLERRLKLLKLAEKYSFAIIEDDYDYDFHFQNKPIAPIASHDKNGYVIYIGTFAKVLAHNFRVGYIIAPHNFIHSLTSVRRLIDRPGDIVLEETMAKLMKANVIRNHIKKALIIYKQRRDSAYELLRNELEGYVQLDLPLGGLAFWVHFDKCISLQRLSALCAGKRLYFPDATFYNTDENACRMGFASMNINEMQAAVEILKKAIPKAIA